MAAEGEDSIDLAPVAAVQEAENSEEEHIAVEELQYFDQDDFRTEARLLTTVPGSRRGFVDIS